MGNPPLGFWQSFGSYLNSTINPGGFPSFLMPFQDLFLWIIWTFSVVMENTETPINKYPTKALDVVYDKDEGNTDWNIRSIGARVLSWIDHGFMVTYSDADKKSLEEWNPRLLHQKGAFFVFGNQTNPPHVGAATYNVKSTSILPKIADTPHLLKEAKTIVIPKELKQEVISALEEKGITESYIYPNEAQL